MFEALNKKYFYIENVTNIAFVEEAYQYSIKENKPVTLLVNANILSCVNDGERKKTASLNKYDALKYILSLLDEKDFLLASHGDIAKEIYNIRKKNGQTHNNDLLLSNSHEQITSIAYGLALNSTKNIWCIDSDSTLLYNLGGTANVLLNTQRNMKYILIDDESQFSSDGQNAHLHLMDIKKMLKSMGVKNTMEAYTYEDIKIGMLRLAREKSALIIKVSRDKPLKIVQNDYDAKKNFEEFKGKFQKT
jgi:phosphonopyruvate decarboxylase